ncbi:bucentaur or craniofacial development-domain-containing protein [Suillus paluster]|uniref:bucentaur or craniofacial development-domain-containing protein n=1 Tax=Suillus paluster TaxID=48578 RepID=UPI001B86FA63|nr:bucentaur or craniofacial development-domain-containing protein [Suillus paluster]KAG1741462.1 bucentaur or craniofacial development-domain-containing protein [Suillus paluster]
MSPPRDPTSDSEDDDPDYVPPEHQDSDSSGDEEGNDETTLPNEVKEQDLAEKKKARDTLWASFQASVASPPPPKVQEPPRKPVKIEKRYLFAGKNIVEVVEVPEDSEDAKQWPRWQPPESSSVAAPAPESSSSTTDVGLSASMSAGPMKPLAQKSALGKPPGPRKPRTSLADIPTQKAKKITTLDKSAMDWRAHVTSSDVKDELDANRRGGGYLEKMDFLKRVEDRREDAFEASKSNKRRRT